MNLQNKEIRKLTFRALDDLSSLKKIQQETLDIRISEELCHLVWSSLRSGVLFSALTNNHQLLFFEDVVSACSGHSDQSRA